jgi:hypothetical protein
MQAMNLYSYREKPHNLALTTKIWLSEVTGYSLKSRKKKKKRKEKKKKKKALCFPWQNQHSSTTPPKPNRKEPLPGGKENTFTTAFFN